MLTIFQKKKNDLSRIEVKRLKVIAKGRMKKPTSYEIVLDKHYSADEMDFRLLLPKGDW